MNEMVRFENTLPLSAADVHNQIQLIQQVMRDCMKEGVHYGKVPGTDKPSLWKPGAEKLCLVFRLYPDYDTSDTIRDGQQLSITTKCLLRHIPTDLKVGSGMGSCTTLETKYLYRHGIRTCPICAVPAIIKGKEEYGGGWVCFKRKDGCGAKFADGDQDIESQQVGKIVNEDLADQYNTVLKMSNKRALVAATLVATAASDIFTQDLEDDDLPPLDAGNDESATTRTETKKPVQQAKKKAEKKTAPVDDKPATPGFLKMVKGQMERAGLTTTDLHAKFGVDESGALIEGWTMDRLMMSQANDVQDWIKNPAGK